MVYRKRLPNLPGRWSILAPVAHRGLQLGGGAAVPAHHHVSGPRSRDVCERLVETLLMRTVVLVVPQVLPLEHRHSGGGDVRDRRSFGCRDPVLEGVRAELVPVVRAVLLRSSVVRQEHVGALGGWFHRLSCGLRNRSCSPASAGEHAWCAARRRRLCSRWGSAPCRGPLAGRCRPARPARGGAAGLR